jgi:hypothetical protein
MENLRLFFDYFNAFIGLCLLYQVTIGLKQNNAKQSRVNEIVRNYRTLIVLVGLVLIIVSVFNIIV